MCRSEITGIDQICFTVWLDNADVLKLLYVIENGRNDIILPQFCVVFLQQDGKDNEIRILGF